MRRFSSLTRREFLGTTAAAGAALAGAGVLPRGLAAAEAAPGPYIIGCYTRPWDAFEYRVALDAIAQAGFKHAGLMTTKSTSHLVLSVDSTLDEAQQVSQECRQRGLDVISIYGGDFHVAKSLDEGIKGLRHLIDVCAAAGSPMLLLGGTNEKLYEAYFKAVAECCPYAGEKKVSLTIKPHGGTNATGGQLRKAIELVGKKEFTVCYDAGNIFYYSDGKINPLDDAPSVDGLVTAWCIKDFTLEPKKDVWVTPGTGLVDFAGVFARLKKGGFTRGSLVVETVTRPNPTDLPQLLAETKKAREFLEGMVHAA